jgi:hypothetical protein
MKVLTLTQPYANLVAIGAKRIETRSWETLYRGPLAIHAGKGLRPVGGKQGLMELCRSEPFRSVLLAAGYLGTPALPLGAIVATCELVDCRRIPAILPDAWGYLTPDRADEWQLTDQERAFGDYTPGRFAWLLSNVRALPEPVPCKGALGLWNYEGAL